MASDYIGNGVRTPFLQLLYSLPENKKYGYFFLFFVRKFCAKEQKKILSKVATMKLF